MGSQRARYMKHKLATVFLFYAFDILFLSWFLHGLLLVLLRNHINDGGVLPKSDVLSELSLGSKNLRVKLT